MFQRFARAQQQRAGTLLAHTRTATDHVLLAQDQLVVAQTYLASPAVTLAPLVVPDIEAEPRIDEDWREIARARAYRLVDALREHRVD